MEKSTPSLFKIAPSILSADFSKLGHEINEITKAGAHYVHVDVMDGHFVPNLTIGAPVVESLKKHSQLALDCHLMISDPEKYIVDFIKAGADIITFHYEAIELSSDKKIQKIIELSNSIRDAKVLAGLSIKPKTKPEEIFHLLKYFDLILVMSVEPGFSGQKFMPDCAQKLSVLRKESQNQNLNLLLEIDGGINAETAKECRDADILVAGHAVFRSSDYLSAIQNLKQAKVNS